MEFDQFYIVGTSVSGKGKDDVGEFDILGRVENDGKV